MAINKRGRQSFVLPQLPVIQHWASIAGKKESEGPLAHTFDITSQDTLFGQKTWEQAEKRMQQMSEEFQKMVNDFFAIQRRDSAAMKEVQTKLEILDDEFQMKHRRNPIHHMQSRLKTIQSMMEKLQRKQFAVSMESAMENLKDIAGIRVICSYVQDVYTVAKLLTSQDDIRLVEMRDYIRSPKPNGYRSLHLIITVPVFFAQQKRQVKVEVQIRTIAMDFWASLEHKMYYKFEGNAPENIRRELKECADLVAFLDQKMLAINEEIQRYAGEAEDDDTIIFAQ